VHSPVLNERARMLSPSALARADRATLQPHLAAIQAALNEEKRKYASVQITFFLWDG
jgi:hypothetical protein